MQSKILKSPSKSTLHWVEAGEKQKNSLVCKRCSGTGLITTWYDVAESHKVTTECPVCPPTWNLENLRSQGL